MDAHKFFRTIIDCSLPQACLLCGAHSGATSLCTPCRDDLPTLPAQHCPICAIPTPLADVCGDCLKKPPAFDRSIAAWSYRWPIDRLIPAFKYGTQLAIAKPLAMGIAQAVTATGIKIDGLIPMPLHPSRQRERGFNQSHELARHVASILHIPLLGMHAVRVKLTPPQASLPFDERHRAIKGAFAVKRDVVGKHLVLIDDVMTTGASLDELAKTLKRAGASRVDCWIAARALKD